MSAEIKQKQVEQTEKPQKQEKEHGTVMSLVLNILKETAEFKGWELIWQVLMYGFLLWGVYNASLIYEFHTSPQYAHVDKLSIYDFKFSLIMAVFFQGYKMFCQWIFYKPVYNLLDPAKFPTHEEKHKRAKYACIWVSNIIYYTFSSVLAFVLFKDTDFWPTILGGSADSIDSFKHFPYAKNFEYGTAFYMMQFGAHLHTLIDYCINKWNDPKFWEMFLHHILAVQLIFFSYMGNIHRIGILVMFVHDPCDVFLCINRLISDAKHKSIVVQAGFYFVFVISWLFFRLFAFPKAIINAALTYVFTGDVGIMFPVILFLDLMLVALVILHLYWFVFIVRILVVMASGKKEYNLYDNKAKKKAA